MALRNGNECRLGSALSAPRLWSHPNRAADGQPKPRFKPARLLGYPEFLALRAGRAKAPRPFSLLRKEQPTRQSVKGRPTVSKTVDGGSIPSCRAGMRPGSSAGRTVASYTTYASSTPAPRSEERRVGKECR